MIFIVGVVVKEKQDRNHMDEMKNKKATAEMLKHICIQRMAVCRMLQFILRCVYIVG